ncbi:MAG: TIGR03086 family metal-binding protein [Actinomycetota bacterium]|nr:TIGR03086 family metal-binding protein [Actinomycetota bacterium]MDH5312831.1 TIGR03086 family metal-binding protein [Actinomycetota bacterium]
MRDVAQRYVAALDEVDRHVRVIRPDQWSNATPCTEWDVRALVDHLVYETLWVPDLVAGKTLQEVGDRYEGERLGDDPIAAWTSAKSSAVAGVAASRFDMPVHTSGGQLTADEYLTQMLFDAVIHGWDLSKGVKTDHAIPDDVAQDLEEWFAPQVEQMLAARIIARPVALSEDTDAATRLIALSGRDPYHPIAIAS